MNKQETINLQSLRIVYFGHNRSDAALVRRIKSMRNIGLTVTAFTFRRDGEPEHPGPDWDNIDLGYVEHAKLLRRVVLLASALLRIAHNRSIVRSADIIYARNLDIFMLAWFALLLTIGRNPRVVYECLDVHESLTRNGLPARILRWLERRVLRRIDLLVVSSPGFIENYFKPFQNFKGRYFLVENKLYFSNMPVDRPELNSLIDKEKRPVIVTWVGILRCQRTLDLLKELATIEGERILIRLHGMISYFLIPDFDEQIEGFPNIIFKGAYKWPEGLADAYQDADFVWAQELSWRGHNSDWLIPNRVYEGSYFGVLSLCVAGTETARFVAERDIGFVLPNDTSATLIDFFRNFEKKTILAKQQALLCRPSSDFVETPDDMQRLVRAIGHRSQND